MSTADVLEIPERVGLTQPASSGPTLPPSGVVKIVVEGKEFKIADPWATPFALEKLRRMEDGSYTFPSEWGVHSTEFSTLIDFLRSTR